MRQSWRANAQAWIAAVRSNSIGSRRVATDEAIIHAVMALDPRRVLDLGCGEGWLCRALTGSGITAVGVDGSPELLAAARRMGGEFHLADYHELPRLRATLGKFPAIVCNYSLLEADLAAILRMLTFFLDPGGSLLIQTLHPWRVGEDDYRDGWRVETYRDFEGRFAQPMPWYFRSLTSWVRLLGDAGFHIHSLSEPMEPKSGLPLSLLMECKLTTC